MSPCSRALVAARASRVDSRGRARNVSAGGLTNDEKANGDSGSPIHCPAVRSGPGAGNGSAPAVRRHGGPGRARQASAGSEPPDGGKAASDPRARGVGDAPGSAAPAGGSEGSATRDPSGGGSSPGLEGKSRGGPRAA